MAGQTLAEAGAKTLMLDVGNKDSHYKKLIPEKNFISIRETETGQHRYFLGDKFESLSWEEIGAAAQLTPPRKYLARDVTRLLPFVSGNFFPFESLAYGGLGSGWGLGCCVFSPSELGRAGLDRHRMNDAYRTVCGRIGISGEKDDAFPYTLHHLENFQKATGMDANAKSIREKYLKKKSILNKEGFFAGRPALALLSEDLGERKKINYADMDFYADQGLSAYRPWITVEELKKKNNFSYHENSFVTKFSENETGVEIDFTDTRTNEIKKISGKKLLLASGTLGSARIALRSFHSPEKLPLLCNPYTYIPCLHWPMLGKESSGPRTGFAQLAIFYDKDKTNFNVAMASVYSYRSLMLFRIMKEMPLNFYDGRLFAQYIVPAMVIAGIHHPEEYSPGNYVSLTYNGSSPANDLLNINYTVPEKRKSEIAQSEKKFMWALRKLGCLPLKKVDPGMGSSIHYAGTLPFSGEEKPFTLSPEGRLHGTKNVFVADGSGFRYLPAKGLTFSLMANAHLVAENALKNA